MFGFGKALLPVAFKMIDRTKAISQKLVQLKSKSIRRTSACKLLPRIADRADSAEKRPGTLTSDPAPHLDRIAQ